MADKAMDADTAAASGDGSLVEDATSAAAGLRSTARWVASALAAIPSVAILATLLKPPEGEQFDDGRLFVALALAAAAALLGIIYFSRVLRPAQLKETDLDDFEMAGLPNAPFGTIDELRDSAKGAHHAVADKQVLAGDAEADAAFAKARSDQAKAALETIEKQLKDNPNDPGLQDLARVKRGEWSKLDLESGALAALAASSGRVLKGKEEQLNARIALLRDAYRLKTTEIVASKYKDALVACGFAVAMIALAIFLLLTAPEKGDEPFSPTLVKLNLSDEGMRTLGCESNDVTANPSGANR